MHAPSVRLVRLPSLCLAAALAAGVMLASAASAQPEPGGPGGSGPAGGGGRRGASFADPDQRLAHLTSVLSLSEEQQAAIRPILEDERDAVVALRDKAQSEGKGLRLYRGEMRAMREEYDTRIRAELSGDQLKAFDQFRQGLAKRGGPHKAMRPRMGPGAGAHPQPPMGGAPPPAAETQQPGAKDDASAAEGAGAEE